MLKQSFKAGDKDVALVLSKKYYQFRKFLGESYVVPMKRVVPDFVERFETIATYEPANGKKPKKADLKPHIDELLDYCDIAGIDKLLVASADYFKYLTGKTSFEGFIGSALPCKLKDYEHITIVPMLNAAVVSAQPAKRPLLDASIFAATRVINGTYQDSDFEFDHYELIIDPDRAIEVLKELMLSERIAWDIETTGLHHIKMEILTHALAPSETEAYVFAVHPHYVGDKVATRFEKIFKQFFNKYSGHVLVHNAGFEFKTHVWKYFMNSWNDYSNMYSAINNLKFDDTYIINYILHNSTSRSNLGLKDLAKCKFGNWDENLDVKKAITYPIEELARYNAIDVVATYWLYNKSIAELEESQLKFYEETAKPVQKSFLKIMLTGLPMDMNAVVTARKELQDALDEVTEVFYNNSIVQQAEEEIRYAMAEKYNASHKVARREPQDFNHVQFNYKSSNQMQVLLYDIMGHEPIEFSEKTGAPKTDRASIEEFSKLEEEGSERHEVLDCLISFSQIVIILNTFITSFENDSIEVEKGVYRLYGNLKLGGTISFRPSANNP